MNRFHILLGVCLLQHWLYTDDNAPETGFKLGYSDIERSLIVLYDVATDPATLERLRGLLDGTGVRYRRIIHHPDEPFSNISLLDIDL